MVEFTDLQCPFCRQFILTSFDEIKRNWIDTGKLAELRLQINEYAWRDQVAESVASSEVPL